MNLFLVKTLFQKELKEIWRDKKVLFMVVLLPMFLYPLIIIFITQMSAIQSRKINSTKVPIQISRTLTGTALYDSLAVDSQLVLISIDAKERKRDTVAIVQNSISNDKQSLHLTIFFDPTNDYARPAKEKIEKLIGRLNNQLVEKKLDSIHVAKTFLKPFDLTTQSTASKEKATGTVIGKIIPGIILFFITLGALTISLDISPGEKERKTIQSLFATPITSTEILIGKFLAVYVVSIAAAFANFLGMLISLLLVLLSSNLDILSKVGLSISPAGIIWLLMLLLVMTAMVAFTAIALLSMARTHKEASTYMGPLMMVLMLPMMVYNLPAMELGLATAMVPLLNILLSINDILKGSYNTSLLITSIASSCCYVVLMVYASRNVFASEALVTGEKVNYKILLQAKKENREIFGAFDAMVFFAVIMLLYLIVGSSMIGRFNILWSLPLSSILVFGLSAWFIIRRYKLNITRDFSIRIPSAVQLLATILMGVGIYFAIAWLTASVMEEDFVKEFSKVLMPLMEANIVVGLLVIAVVPAVCEELIFRGVIFLGLRQQFGMFPVILISSITFSLMHINMERLFHTFLLGLILGVLMWRGRNIVLCILLHFVVNATSLVCGKYPVLSKLFSENAVLFTGGGVLLFVAGAILFYKGTKDLQIEA